MSATPRILLLGASFEWSALLKGQFSQMREVDYLSDGLELLGQEPFDLVVLNLEVPGSKGLDTFRKARAIAPQVPCIVLTRPEHEALALETLRLGAQDYFLGLPYDAAVAPNAIRKAIERHQWQEEGRRDQHLLEILMGKIPDAIYFKDAASRFLRISRAMSRRFNLTDPELALGKTDADFFTAEHAQQARADETRILKTGLPVVGIEEMETWPDGTISWVSTTKMPLRDRAGKVVGTFGVSRDITARKEAELVLAERTRQLRQRNQQMEEELRMARELQLAMLPQQFPRVPLTGPRERALEFFSLYAPSGTVSGDFFDVVEISDTAVGLFICDVMGHDVRAALVTAMLRALVEDLGPGAADPGHLLGEINRGLAGIFKQTGTTMYATALYLIADLARGELCYASAAHPDAIHLRRKQGCVDTLNASAKKKGPALGLFEQAAFPAARRPFDVGDVVLLYTDGLIEAEGANQECFSNERLTAAVRRRVQLPAKELVSQVMAEVREFCGGAAFGDDISLLGMEVK